MDDPTHTPDDVWEWIEQDTLPGLRPSTCIDYYRMINKVKADAWAEGFDAGERDVMEHESSGWGRDCIPNPYKGEA